LASAPDQREAAHGGESKNGHFTDAHGRATMAAVFRNRRDDILNYGGDEYDE